MSQIQQAWQSIPLEGDLQFVSADQIRAWTGKEPRLMMKFDHSVHLPSALRDSGRFILPLRNGHYAILKGQGYHCPEPCGPIQIYQRQTEFEIKTAGTGLSEMQHLDIAFNTGLLGHFLGEKLLYPTIRGRKRSPQFCFSVDNHQLEVSGVQVEIDGGFEGLDSVTLVEAKIGECEDFHLRQLYYPFRFWSEHTQKRIRCLFFTYQPETQVYRFREYRFEPAEVYASPRLVKATAYQIGDAPVRPFKPIVTQNDCPFPQADRLDKIAIIPILAAERPITVDDLATIFEFSKRQGRYYQDACRALGMLDDQGTLTPFGRDYLRCSPEIRYQVLCRAVLKLPVMQEIMSNLLLCRERSLSKSQVEMIVQEATTLSPVTAKRRSQTVWSWLSWICLYCPALHMESSKLCLAVKPSNPKRAVSEQMELF